MRKLYESAKIEIFLFQRPEVIVASSVNTTTVEKDPDDLPILPVG